MKHHIQLTVLTIVSTLNSLLFCQDIYQLKEVFQHITASKTLVVFDIDNTLLMPKTDLGSDQWFFHMLQRHIDTGLNFLDAVEAVIPMYVHVSLGVELFPTEDDLYAVIEDIQKIGDYVICLTTRLGCLAPKVVEQLQKNKLFFHEPDFQHLETNFIDQALYRSGVLFCGIHEKGEIFNLFLDAIDYEPELIIFIDDKQKNVHSVEKVVRQRNIPFVGLRYAGCDRRVRAFNAEITQQELQKFLGEYPL